MRIRPYLLFSAALCCAVACSEQSIEGPDPITPIEPNGTTATIEAIRNIPESRALPLDEPIFVGFDPAGPAAPATRTTLDDDWHTTKWSPTDQIAVWAADASGNYLFSGTPFRRNHQIAENAAIFTGDLPEMAAGSYRYVACYPVPEADRMDGTRITYTLPAVQDGTYRAELDVLTSDRVEGGSLTDKSKDERISVAMHHRFHALRIRIPSGRNLRGKGVTRLLIDFPHEAVGTATFDLETPDAAPVVTNGGRRIELRFDRPFDASTDDAPQYVWVFVLPGRAEGAISFTPLFEDGFCAETLSAALDKELRGGHVTPINLTVPATEQAVTWLDFTIDHTQLGAPVNTLTVKAPEGAAFRHNASTAELPVSNGRCSIGYYGILYPTAFRGAALELAYDSEHAVVTNTQTLPASLNENEHNSIAVKAPWLFFEDFGLLKGYDIDGGNVDTKKQDGQIINDTFHAEGWTGNQTYGTAGKAIAIRSRYETSLRKNRGRVDSAPMNNLKPNTSVTVNVMFRYGSSAEETRTTAHMRYGYTTTQGAIKAFQMLMGVTSGNEVENATSVQLTDNSGSTSNVNREIQKFNISGCTNLHRLSWELETGSQATSKNKWLYLDDIRVSIVQ